MRTLSMFGRLTIVAVALSLAGCGASSVDGLGVEPGKLAADQTPNITTGSVAKPTPQDLLAAKKTADAVTKRARGSGYLLGAQDVVEVTVFKVEDLSKTVQISDTGTFNYPLVGDVQASGKTAQEVERDLTARLGSKYLENPQVTVRVTEMNSRRITVEGAVKKPGVFPISGRMSLLQGIAKAEGLTPLGSTTVVVIRNEGGKRKAAKFDLEKIRTGDDKDPSLRPGDIIIAPKSAGKETLQNILKVVPLVRVFTLI